MARGIQPKLARNLVAKGFSAEAIETLEIIAMEVVGRKFLAVN